MLGWDEPSINLHALSPKPVPIPVIDFGVLNGHSLARPLVIRDIGRACQTLGCFQVKNHGISQSVIKEALEVSSNFFELPAEERAKFASEDVTRPVRYGSGPQNRRCFLKQYANPINEWVRQWPANPADYREKMGECATELRRVAMQLIDAILESLGLAPAYLREKLEKGMQVLAVNYYQQSSHTLESLLGLAPHSDYGYITILVQTCPGLQFIDKSVQAWRAVYEVPAGTLHVHIGDYLEVLSNGLYKSVVHRAVLDSRKRISIASIHSLAMDEKVTTAKELVDEQQPIGYRDSSFRDFLDYISSTNITDGKSFIDSLRIIGADKLIKSMSSTTHPNSSD